MALANNSLAAHTGPGQTVEPGQIVTLSSTGSSNPGDDTLSYSWNSTSRTAITLSNSASHPLPLSSRTARHTDVQAERDRRLVVCRQYNIHRDAEHHPPGLGHPALESDRDPVAGRLSLRRRHLSAGQCFLVDKPSFYWQEKYVRAHRQQGPAHILHRTGRICPRLHVRPHLRRCPPPIAITIWDAPRHSTGPCT